MKILCLAIALVLNITCLQAQQTAPADTVITDGEGIYRGLKKTPKLCATCPGEFYVSSTDDYSGAPVKWFKETKKATNILDKKDGLAASKALLKWGYQGVDIDKNGISPTLSSYPTGISGTAGGAVEVCFQANYLNGKLIDGTTPSNMWYLPAQDELMHMYKLSENDKNVFIGTFTAEAYWSSTEANAIFAWSTYYGNEYTYTNKSILYGVRCIRR